MDFTEEQLKTGNFTPEQLELIKSVWYQPKLEDDPLFVVSTTQQDVRLRAVGVSGHIVGYPILGWLLLDSNEMPIKFHLGQNTFWKSYMESRQ